MKSENGNGKLKINQFDFRVVVVFNFVGKRLALGYASLFYLPGVQHAGLLEDEEDLCKG